MELKHKLIPGEKSSCRLQLDSLTVRFLSYGKQLCIELSGLGPIAGQLSRPGGAIQSVEPVRSDEQRCFEFLQRLLRFAQFEQQLCKQLARGNNRTGRN